MAKEVIMPKFGFTQETADIVRWLKHEGDPVEMGDLIAEVTTDKVNMEVEAMDSGILAGLKYREGDTVPVAQVIAYILKPGESLPTDAPPPSQPRPDLVSRGAPAAEVVPSPIAATPIAMRVAQELNVDLTRVPGSGIGGRITREDVEGFSRRGSTSGGKVCATPSARRAAREQGIELTQVPGTGPHGRVQTPDVILFSQNKTPVEADIHRRESIVGLGTEAEVVPMSSMRRTIASRLQQSYQQVPHIFFDAEIDMTAIEGLRVYAGKVSITAFITRITAWALTKHPFINSRLDGSNILLMKNINIGIAIALDDGLIVPVIRNADQKPVLQIADEISSLTERAKANQLKLEDLADGTFTISNLGMFGVDRFTAIINPPQTAILAVSRAVKKFVPDEKDQPVLRPMMTVTLAVDHRVIDGALAALFLRDLRDGLERPGRLIL
jgi:pyruvate dehydrogenase E2 component (dihydrolipoamide acetyltransferase)